jgi:ribosomal peptide maturation radical SAM protein 1
MIRTLPPRVVGETAFLDAETRRARAAFPVALVAMPFASHGHPSLQIGLLGAIAASQGFTVETFHLFLDFAAQIDLDLYALLSEHRGMELGEWMFSLAAFDEAAPDPGDRFLTDFASLLQEANGAPLADPAFFENACDRLRRIRHEEVPHFLERVVAGIPWDTFRVVGFTSTFQQTVASLALGRWLKQRFPAITLVYGGANFDGSMGVELVRSMPWIDYAIVGEGDVAFPSLLVALQQRTDPSTIAGVVCRKDGHIVDAGPAAPFERMDKLPVPIYDDYFERAERLGILGMGARRQVFLPFESARGCWWGQKQHCTFCGLNGATMAFRAKSPGRVAAELAELARRYRSFQFAASDNILEPSYVATLLADLGRNGHDYDIFYEVKANMTREQLRVLRDAGVRRIQPGIESFSSHVLALMRKGVWAAQNVNLLRWCQHYGIDVVWNILWGFPGETREDYEEQARLLPRLVHLQPPVDAGRIHMERFSPIFFDRQAFPVRSMRPERSYGYVYPAHVDLEKVAYVFESELEGTLSADAYAGLTDATHAWQKAWSTGEQPSLRFWSSPDLLVVEDRRTPASPLSYTFEEPVASVYLACSDRPRTAAGARETARLDLSERDVGEALRELEACGLVMQDGDRFVSLAVPATPGR